MDFSNKNQNANKRITLEQATEMWSRLCLFHIKQKKSKYQNNNKENAYIYAKK